MTGADTFALPIVAYANIIATACPFHTPRTTAVFPIPEQIGFEIQGTATRIRSYGATTKTGGQREASNHHLITVTNANRRSKARTLDRRKGKSRP